MNRPAGVPEGAWWEEGDGEWVLGPLDDAGEKHGVFSFWRADGTKCAENRFAHGVVCGEFRRFHENGEVSQSGVFDDAGEIHGTRSWICCDAPTSENTRPPGASDAVWRSEMDYVHGKPVATRHFDRRGNRVRPDGQPYPPRPAGVDPRAELIEDEWVLAEVDAAGVRNGVRRAWSSAGALEEEGEWRNGEREGRFRWWNEDGVLERLADMHAGRKDGRWWSLVPPGEYADARIRREKGGFHEDFAIGPWEFSDEKGHLLRLLDFGVPVEVTLESPVFADGERPAKEWTALGDELRRARQHGEALCAWARASAAARDGSSLEAHLLARTACLAEAAATRHAEEALASAGESPAALVNALVRGASPAMMLRALAVLLDRKGASRAAMDFVDAALLLAPDARELFFTRSLVAMSLGRKEQAIADAQRLNETQPEQARFLLDYTRILFPSFDFWPARSEVETFYDGLPEAPAQPLERVRETIRKYATRLTRVRAAMQAQLPGAAPSWMLPDLSAIVGETPPALEQFTFEVATGGVVDEEPEATQVGDEGAGDDEVERTVLSGGGLGAYESAASGAGHDPSAFGAGDEGEEEDEDFDEDDVGDEDVDDADDPEPTRLSASDDADDEDEDSYEEESGEASGEEDEDEDEEGSYEEESGEASGEGAAGVERIEVDETLDVEGWELPALLRAARADWAALTWLCWAVGLDRVALPERIAPPENFGQAAGMSAQRLWRCRDKVHVGGQGARTANTPGFTWESLEIDEMSPHLARIAENEYAEMQALFHWLSDARNRSPWQDNLRGS